MHKLEESAMSQNSGSSKRILRIESRR